MQYKFDHTTLRYVRVKEPRRVRQYRVARAMLLFFVVIAGFNLIIALNYYTPQTSYLESSVKQNLEKYEQLRRRMGATSRKIEELAARDKGTYRQIMALDTAYVEGVYTPYSDGMYARLATLPYSSLIVGSWQTIDDIARRLYLRSVSLDTLQGLAMDKDKMTNAIPAIWPVLSRKINSLYGMRYHPLYRQYVRHSGLDLAGKMGDPVYATANGYVKIAREGGRYSGYGTQVLIDHGFGYQTRYGHLSKLEVEEGVWVRRGELIGRVGSTGGVSGPHLHYEVIQNGQTVNPINYLRSDITPEEFERIIKEANENPETVYEPDVQ